MAGNESPFRFPGLTHRTSIIGRTGSGKTAFGVWLLSEAEWDKQPFYIVDYKNDDILKGIHAPEVKLSDKLEKEPGLYFVRPRPVDDDEEVNDWLRVLWEKGRTGLYIDEGYMLPGAGVAVAGSFTGILTQGRSKRIPVIILSQRPAWLNRFVFSEADFVSVFHLNHMRDQKRVDEFVPRQGIDHLPQYHSRWFDVSRNRLLNMRPVPRPEDSVARINDRLQPRRKGNVVRLI